MKNQETTPKKELKQLSDEELEKVNGGSLNARLAINCDQIKCPELGKETDLKTCECI